MKNLSLGEVFEFTINDDPARVIRFNANDVKLREKIFNFAKEASRKEKEFNKRIKEIDAIEGDDEYGFSLQAAPSMDLVLEIADYFMKGLDDVFGAGTSEIVFADGFDFDSFTVFLGFVLDKFNETGNKKVQARLAKKSLSKAMK